MNVPWAAAPQFNKKINPRRTSAPPSPSFLEISLTTTVDREVGNVLKCLRVGFRNVAIICLDEDRLRKIAAAVAGSLGEKAEPLVKYYQPDQFIAHLKALPGLQVKAKPRPT